MAGKRNYVVLFIVVLATAGCVSGYKTVGLHEVRTKETDQGRVSVLEERGYIAFKEVIERSPNVKSVTRMTDLKGEREPGNFAVSPDGQWVVYQAQDVVGGVAVLNLWRISTSGGTAITQLTAGRYFDLEPAYTPDGKHIYFASNRISPLPKLWRIQSDGAGGITRITQANAEDRTPSVVPDGTQVYYASRPFNATEWQVWRIGSGGNLPTQLREGCFPRVSPDGSRVLFSVQDRQSGKWKIWIMDADGSNLTQLTTGTESDDQYASWSPDGQRIVYASDIGRDSNGKRNFDIWVMDADGANLTQLTTNGSTDLFPVFSPDGQQIYFLSNRGFHWDIWRMEMVATSP